MNNPNLIEVESDALKRCLNADMIDFDRMKAFDDDTGRERSFITRKGAGEWFVRAVNSNHSWPATEELAVELDALYSLYLAERIVK